MALLSPFFFRIMYNKQEKIDLALAKLTEEERVLLGLVKKPAKVKVKKSSKLTLFYGLGKSDATLNESATISLNNPFLVYIIEALDKMVVPNGSWAIMFDNKHLSYNLKHNHITQLQHDLLYLVIGYGYENTNKLTEFFDKYNFENTDINLNYIMEFDELFIDEHDNNFVVYEGYSLK